MNKIKLISHDSVFLKGEGHTVCEDYAFSGLIQGKYPCAIISDGCSQSKHTDIGARIIVRSMLNTLNNAPIDWLSATKVEGWDDILYDTITKKLAGRMQQSLEMFSLPYSSLDATVRLALLIGDYLFVYHFGDGHTTVNDPITGHTIHHWYSKYESNAPYYFSHHMDPYQHACYKAKFADTVVDVDLKKNEPISSMWTDKTTSYDCINLGEINPGKYVISVMSDGVETFTDEHNNEIKDFQVLREFHNYKGLKGEMVKRRINRAIKNYNSDGFTHFDDISVASISIEVEE